jgi:hypothetical protein
MKKQFYKRYFFWVAIVVVVVAGIFFVAGVRREKIISASSNNTASSKESQQSVKNNAEGYSFNIPASWYVENSATSTVVVYPNYSPANSSSSPICKIEMSVFPYASSTSVSDWISHRLDGDPTVDITEQSSEAISLNGAVFAIKWIGTMNEIFTTVVYAFNNDYAYEIVPSNLNGAGSCNDALDVFLQKLTL